MENLYIYKKSFPKNPAVLEWDNEKKEFKNGEWKIVCELPNMYLTSIVTEEILNKLIETRQNELKKPLEDMGFKIIGIYQKEVIPSRYAVGNCLMLSFFLEETRKHEEME